MLLFLAAYEWINATSIAAMISSSDDFISAFFIQLIFGFSQLTFDFSQ
jgi:hypothetical protein